MFLFLLGYIPRMELPISSLVHKEFGSHHFCPYNKERRVEQTENHQLLLDPLETEVTAQTTASKMWEAGGYRESQCRRTEMQEPMISLGAVPGEVIDELLEATLKS